MGDQTAGAMLCPFDNVPGSAGECYKEQCSLWVGQCAFREIALALAGMDAKDEHRLANEAAAPAKGA